MRSNLLCFHHLTSFVLLAATFPVATNAVAQNTAATNNSTDTANAGIVLTSPEREKTGKESLLPRASEITQLVLQEGSTNRYFSQREFLQLMATARPMSREEFESRSIPGSYLYKGSFDTPRGTYNFVLGSGGVNYIVAQDGSWTRFKLDYSVLAQEPKSKLEVYLVKPEEKLTLWSGGFELDLDGLSLEAKPLIIGDDVKSFSPGSGGYTLTLGSNIKLTRNAGVEGIYFVVVVDGRREFLGNFLSGASSMVSLSSTIVMPGDYTDKVEVPNNLPGLNKFLRYLNGQNKYQPNQLISRGVKFGF